jgi:hypothetical protein
MTRSAFGCAGGLSRKGMLVVVLSVTCRLRGRFGGGGAFVGRSWVGCDRSGVGVVDRVAALVASKPDRRTSCALGVSLWEQS